MVGNFDMPFVYAQNVQLENIKLIGFNNTKGAENASNKIKTVHFFLDDYKFDEVWNKPETQLVKLSQYVQLFSPDFSIYDDLPEPMKIYNTFRNRWCASYWQFNKLLVIPTVSWGDEKTFEYCFDGIEEGCVVAVSTVGASNDQKEFMLGFKQMCNVIKPGLVLNYGNQFSEMDSYAQIVSLPYRHGSKRNDN